MMPSRAMACNNRGAPVRLWSAAPQQEKKEPITISQGDGQASAPITGFLCSEKPNLKQPQASVKFTRRAGFALSFSIS